MTQVPVNALLLVLCTSILIAGNLRAETVVGRVVGITDGDTFTLLTEDHAQLKIRVAEIDAPERGQPYANRSRQALAALVFGKTVRVDVQVVDNYGRLVGRPFVETTDVCAEMIAAGAAWVYRSYSEDVVLYELERQARAELRGVWSLPEYERIPPWEWRNGKPPGQAASRAAEPFKCGAKTYCSEMIGCDEAVFHLESCGLGRLDGDGDGVPCEAICR